MSNTVKQLGFIPTNRGEFDTTGQTRYYKDNVVQYRNGSYICTPVGYSSSNPTAYTTDAPYQDGDTQLHPAQHSFHVAVVVVLKSTLHGV